MRPHTMAARRDPADAVQLIRLLYDFAVYVRSAYVLKLLVCILVDIIGFASFLLPGIGEFGDLGWAPIQGAFLVFMFGSFRIGTIGVLEEVNMQARPFPCCSWQATVSAPPCTAAPGASWHRLCTVSVPGVGCGERRVGLTG